MAEQLGLVAIAAVFIAASWVITSRFGWAWTLLLVPVAFVVLVGYKALVDLEENETVILALLAAALILKPGGWPKLTLPRRRTA